MAGGDCRGYSQQPDPGRAALLAFSSVEADCPRSRNRRPQRAEYRDLPLGGDRPPGRPRIFPHEFAMDRWVRLELRCGGRESDVHRSLALKSARGETARIAEPPASAAGNRKRETTLRETKDLDCKRPGDRHFVAHWLCCG